MDKNLSYERKVLNNHVIHIIKFNDKQFHTKIVKARNSVLGREKVAAIAQRMDAYAAVNGGFFEIGRDSDGKPSGTLIADGKIISLVSAPQSLLIFNKQQSSITRAQLKLILFLDNHEINVHKINNYTHDNEIVIFNDAWGSHTLSSFQRNEVVIDAHMNIISVHNHGNSEIPKNGWVLSFPASSDMSAYKKLKHARIKLLINENNNEREIPLTNFSVVSGIPMLMKDGIVTEKLAQFGNVNFSARPQARTAFGIGSDGTQFLVVVEHVYTQPLRDITLGQVAELLRVKKYSRLRLMFMTLPQLRSIVEQHYSNASGEVGMTLVELAEFMKSLGCVDAINLDGGGSSSMYVQGKMVNKAVGDADEGLAQQTFRAVSDALVVMRARDYQT